MNLGPAFLLIARPAGQPEPRRDDYAWVTARLVELANRHARMPGFLVEPGRRLTADRARERRPPHVPARLLLRAGAGVMNSAPVFCPRAR